MRKKILLTIIGTALVLGGFFVIEYGAATSRGGIRSMQVVEILPGENVFDVGRKLQDAGIVSWQGYLDYFVWKKDLRHLIVAGKYQLNGSMSVSDIVSILTRGDVVPKSATVTFPEGFDSRKMADRLNANALPGDAFLELVKHPKETWREQFWFLKDLPKGASLEGFLFPDTYTFAFDISPEDIVARMLKNFEVKFPDASKTEIERQGKNVFDIVTMASIVENEVRSGTDRAMVADLFWRRIAIGQALQSDATVKYVNGESKVQHSFEETRIDSPYNTYINKGLPPGPISNPGADSLLATVFPKPNPFFYFLTDTVTGETVFSVTFDEHKANKAKHGL